ncbi:MAG TPA: ABC transporter permease [Atribacterota bacterium]|nr:ABC transporter permease [Atribacterota bacterium]
MQRSTKEEAINLDLSYRKKSQFREIWRRLWKNKVAIIGLVILVSLISLMVFADMIASYDRAINHNMLTRLKGPSREHWLGTDSFGRSVFARIIHGSRISLSIGFICVFFSLILGGSIGSIAGFYGNKVDIILMRFMDMFMAIPSMLLAISIVSALGPGIRNLVLAISIAEAPGFAVIVRSSVLTIKNSEYIESARAIGVNPIGIILKHILPNTIGPIIVHSTLCMGGVILTAASLSFVGLGVMPPTPEWGAMLTEGKEYMRDLPFLVIFPGLAIVFAVLALNFLGDGLRDALDPRLKH